MVAGLWIFIEMKWLYYSWWTRTSEDICLLLFGYPHIFLWSPGVSNLAWPSSVPRGQWLGLRGGQRAMTPLFPTWDSAPVFLQCPHQACLQAVFLSVLAQWSRISEKLSYPGSQLINDQSSEISLLYWRKEEWVPLIIRAARNYYR